MYDVEDTLCQRGLIYMNRCTGQHLCCILLLLRWDESQTLSAGDTTSQPNHKKIGASRKQHPTGIGCIGWYNVADRVPRRHQRNLFPQTSSLRWRTANAAQLSTFNQYIPVVIILSRSYILYLLYNIACLSLAPWNVIEFRPTSGVEPVSRVQTATTINKKQLCFIVVKRENHVH